MYRGNRRHLRKDCYSALPESAAVSDHIISEQILTDIQDLLGEDDHSTSEVLPAPDDSPHQAEGAQ